MGNEMNLDIGQHLQEADFEQYSMGTLPAERIAPFEEHLIACNSCQDQLLEMEAFVNAVRSVSPKLRPAEKPRFRTPLFAWAGAAATIAAALLIARIWIPAPISGPVAVVLLQASRGIEGLDVAAAVAGQPLSLQIDPTEFSLARSYRLQIVESTGKQVAESEVTPKNGKIVSSLSKGLPAGKYYVRLYGAKGELLREYGLQIR